MSTTTICQVCENAVARYSCSQCGASVCTEHYDAELGLCATCASRARGGGGGGRGDGGLR
ncbi:MAG: zinc finger HIT domain-containing protein [Haloplanus sp.]